MNFLSSLDTPLQIELSFYQVIEKLEHTPPSSEAYQHAQSLLAAIAPFPELKNGITDIKQITENADLISRLLVDYFPPALTLNEIKAVNFPYTNVFFNHTERFKNLLRGAGPNFDITIRDFDEHQFYVLSCCIILNEIYGTQLDFFKPMFYDIPTADGVIKHYRILYNGDFLDIIPTEKSVPLSQEDIDLLLNNYSNIDLWKQKFPPGSWLLRGFAIMTLFDATVENAVSIFKEKLLGLNTIDFQKSMESIFQSIYRISDIKIGFTVYNQDEDSFFIHAFGDQMKSYILRDNDTEHVENILCIESYRRLISNKDYFAISNTEEFLASNPTSALAHRLLSQNVHSFIIAPVVKNNQLLGVLEVVSVRPKELNSINANKLDVVMPFLTDTVERLIAQVQNELQAVIQTNYTAIHNSVYWKFREEALKFIRGHRVGNEYALQEIVFPDVYPLYGQIDIKNSSDARNTSVQNDLQAQLTALLEILDSHSNNHFFEEAKHHVLNYLIDLQLPLKASTELSITTYLDVSVHPHLREVADLGSRQPIQRYFANSDKETGSFHIYRRKYENTVTTTNDKLARIIDQKQKDAQLIFPHYYERFKTDGVDHNLYIGASINPKIHFTIEKLHQLRLWQLRTLCEMEAAHHQLKPSLPYQLDVTTLVLVYHSTMSIRFRMDEKRFDVDGSYNARFEIVKKRIDKAHIKDTDERITQIGKITIVYSNDTEEEEYLGYIKTLQSQHLLEDALESFEVEPLQGVTGLKALRVGIIH